MFPTASLMLMCLAGLCLALLGEYRDRVSWALCGKVLAASAYLAVALVQGAWSTDWGRLLFFGMVFCWFGDLLLVSRRRRSLFLAGLVSFLLGHLFYSFAFLARGVSAEDILLPLVLVVVFVLLVQRWLRPHLDPKMVLPVHAYLGAISVMWLLAIATHAGQGGSLLLVGASLFVISDLAVARNRFVKPSFINRLWGLPVYFSAQMLLALSAGG